MAIRPLTFLLALGPLFAVAQEAPGQPPVPPTGAPDGSAAPGRPPQAPGTPSAQAPTPAQAAEAKTMREKAMAAMKGKEISGTTALLYDGTPTELNRIPGSVRVFTSDAIQSSGAHTLGEFLAYVLPGQAQSTGQPGQASNAYLGGSRPQDLQVTLDGMNLSDPSSQSVDLNMIPLVGIDRVEVISSGASARFGPHAMGGLVALYSAGTTGAGSHGEILVGGGGQQKRGGVMPAFGWDNGFVRFGATRYEDKPTVEASHAYRQGTVFGSVGQKLSDLTTITLTYRNFYQTVPLPFQEATALDRVYNPDRYAELRGNQAVLGFQFNVGPRFKWDFQVGGMNLRRSDPPDADYPDGPQTRYESSRLQAAVGFHWTLSPKWGLSLRVGAEQERGTLPGYLGGEDEGRSRMGSLGLELRYDLTPTVRLIAQGRQDVIQQRFTGADGDQVDMGTYRPATFRLGINKAFKWGIHAYGAVGTGFNTPLLIQNMENTRVGQAALATERSRYAQIGIGLERGGFSIRFELARTIYDDLVEPNSSGSVVAASGGNLTGLVAPKLNGVTILTPCVGGTGPNGEPLGFCNSGRYRLQGLETTLSYRTPWRIPVGLDAFVRTQEARDLNAPPGQQFSTVNVQNRPFTTHGFRLFGGGARVRVETKWNRVGRRYENVNTFSCSDLAPLVTPTYVSYDDLSVTTTYTVSRIFQMILRGEHLAQKNITVTDWQGQTTTLPNNAYQVYGVPAPKPTVTVEMRFRY